MAPAPASYTIRPALERDLEALVDFRIRLFRELGEGPDAESLTTFEAACRRAFIEGFRAETCLAWLAEDYDGVSLGTLVMLLFPRIPSPKLLAPTEGYVLNVYVIPEWRRRGIAAALSLAALEGAQAMGLARIRLHATPEGRAAYVRVGFGPRHDEMELLLNPLDTT